jgi:hypothetical protein
MALNPTTRTIQQGNSATSDLTLTRTGGFTGAVAITVTGQPTGMTVTPNPASVTGTTSTLTIQVGATTATGNHTLTIHGTATGLAEQTATLTVTVTTSGAGGNVTYTFCPQIGLPLFVAVQDGTGAWTRVTGTNNVYTFNVGTRGGIAYVTSSGANQFTLNVLYATQSELTGQGQGQCTSTAPTKTINGTVANVGLTEQAYISMGGGFAFVTGALGTSFQLTNVLDGPRDLIAGRLALSGSNFALNKAIIRRAQNPANGSTMAVLDFNAAEAFNPVVRNVTVNNLTTDNATVQMFYFTPTGTAGIFFTEGAGSASASKQYPGVPAANQVTGDLHMMMVVASPAGVPTTMRSVSKMFKDAVDQTVDLGPVPSAVTVSSAATTPYLQPRVQSNLQTEYNKYLFASFGQASGGVTRTTILSTTAAYLGAATAVDIAVPNLSGLTGWDNLWGLVNGVALNWSYTAYGWTAAGGILASPFLEGGLIRTGTRIGTF